METRLLQSYIQEADSLLNQLAEASNNLCLAIEEDTFARRALKEAESTLAGAEAEVVMDATFAAGADKTGPLAGIAQSSKAYPIALESLLAKERANGSAVGYLAAETRRLQAAADGTAIDRQQAETRFSAIRHAADLMAQILRAASV